MWVLAARAASPAPAGSLGWLQKQVQVQLPAAEAQQATKTKSRRRVLDAHRANGIATCYLLPQPRTLPRTAARSTGHASLESKPAYKREARGKRGQKARLQCRLQANVVALKPSGRKEEGRKRRRKGRRRRKTGSRSRQGGASRAGGEGGLKGEATSGGSEEVEGMK